MAPVGACADVAKGDCKGDSAEAMVNSKLGADVDAVPVHVIRVSVGRVKGMGWDHVCYTCIS